MLTRTPQTAIARVDLFAGRRDRSGALGPPISLDLPERAHAWLFDRFVLVCDLYAVGRSLCMDRLVIGPALVAARS